VDNTIEIADPTHVTGSTIDGVGGTNTILLSSSNPYNLKSTNYATLANVSNLVWSNNITVTIDTPTLGEFVSIAGAAGAGDQLTLDGDASFNLSTTALTGVETIATANATAGKTYTFDAADLNDVTAVTGQNGVGQTVALNDTDDLSGIDFTDMETLTFGNFTVNIDTGNLASFATAITGGGTGTLDLIENADYDFSTTALTGVSTITATGATATKTYRFDAADLNDVRTITGTAAQTQVISLNNTDDWTNIATTNIETITLADGASITNSNQNSIQDVTAINGNDGTGERFTITADAAISNNIDLSGVTQTNIERLTIVGNTNANELAGTSGDDWFRATAGADTLDGGNGNDTFYYDYGNNGGISAIKPGDDAGVNGGLGQDMLWFNNGNGTAVIHDIVVPDTDFSTTVGMEILYLHSASGFANVSLGANADAAFAIGIDIGVLNSSEYLRVDGSDAAWTRSITATGTDNGDTLIGGTAADTFTGGGGIDSVYLGASSSLVDTVNLSGITDSNDRDTIFNFGLVGDGADDTVELAAADTTAGTAAGPAAVGNDTTAAGVGGGAYTLTGAATDTSDVIRLQSGASLTTGANGGDLTLSSDGTELLRALSDGTASDSYTGITAATAGDTVFLYAYQTSGVNRGFLYYAADVDNNSLIDATEIHLIGNFDTLSGTLTADNFVLV
jgi:uncharacterized protein YaiE (UPF0345 family)